MSRSNWLPILVVAVVCVVLLGPTAAEATEELAAASGDMACTACHDKPGSKRLTDPGKYFELMRTLDGYDEVVEAFGGCTTCHTSRPGSMDLTPKGRRFVDSVEDMRGLLDWVRASHPQPEVGEGESPQAEDEGTDAGSADEDEEDPKS